MWEGVPSVARCAPVWEVCPSLGGFSQCGKVFPSVRGCSPVWGVCPSEGGYLPVRVVGCAPVREGMLMYM